MSKRQRVRERGVERPAPEPVKVGPPSRLVGGLAVALESVPAIYEKDIEKGAKIALALVMYYDPATDAWYPASAPRGTPETVIKAYKPDTNTYEYLRLDSNYRLYVVEYFASQTYWSYFEPSYTQLLNADLTVAQSITLDTRGRSLVSIYAKADAATTFHVDVSADNTNWFTDVLTYTNATLVSDTIVTGFRYVRLRSDAAGVSGNKVTLALSAKAG
jgi:hypothetical protein